MKLLIPIFFFLMVLFCVSIKSFSAEGFPVIAASPLSQAAPLPSPSVSSMVTVAEPSAPPAWAQDLIVSAQKLPVVGPIVSKALLWLGILSSIMTLFTGFVLSCISVLTRVFSSAGLLQAAEKVAVFRDGKLMYYLKFFSLFNAQKAGPVLAEEPKEPAVS